MTAIKAAEQNITAIRHQYWLTAILVLALALRLIYGLVQNPSTPYQITGGDNTWYLANGYALASGFESGNLDGYGSGQYPISLKNLPTPPLYLLMVGFVQRILPHEGAIIAIRLAQALMSVATCYFAYRLATHIANDERAGLIAAGVLAISPAFVMESAQIATETLYIFLATGGLWLCINPNLKNREVGRMILVGVILGLATLTRAVLLLFPLGLALHLLMVYGVRKGLKYALLLLIVYGLTVSTWTIYNLARWNRWVIAAEGFAAFLYIGGLDAGWQGPQAVDQSLGGNLPSDTADQQQRYTEGAQQIISRDPLGYIKRRVTEVAEAYLQPHGTLLFSGESLRELALGWLRNDRTMSGLLKLTRGDAFWPKLSLYIFHYAGLIGGLVGMVLSRKHWRVTLPLIGFIIYTTLIHLILTALPRYLFPNEVFWWVFTAVAWSLWTQSSRGRNIEPSISAISQPIP